MSVRIRLMRTGRKNLPAYRICVFNQRTRRDGPALEILGWYNPLSREAGKGFRIDEARLVDWVRRGALPTLPVTALLKRQGVVWMPEDMAAAQKARAGKDKTRALARKARRKKATAAKKSSGAKA